uniref:Uncharacterized protein n=1 Tax=Panagrolaimus sp. ES5 TaxID=591445 RepID=A0AC34GV87_9BILA
SVAMESSFSNPLASIMAKSLAYEVDNYDDIFNPLPMNPADIRYIEDFSKEEWAEQAAYYQQREYAKKLTYSMNAMITALEDALVEKLLASGQISGTISYSVGETAMHVEIGKMSDLLSQIHVCNEWTIQLPNSVTDLNNENLTETDIYRLSLFCQENNIFMYTENAYSLVTSGYVNSTLKTVGGEIIAIENTTAPIIITGNNRGESNAPTKMTYKDFEDHEILDIHTFLTEQWNGTMFIEIRVLGKNNSDEDGNQNVDDAILFASYQLLPGPLPNDHDLSFTLNKNGATFVFFDQRSMLNKTGRYYIGMGNQNCDSADNNNTVSYDNVTTQFVPSGTCYQREVPIKYSVKAITKAAYFFNETEGRFVNTGIIVN